MLRKSTDFRLCLVNRLNGDLAVFVAVALLLTVVGCGSSEKWIERRPEAPAFVSMLGFSDQDETTLSATTTQISQTIGLNPRIPSERIVLLSHLEERSHSQKQAEVEFALCELAAKQGDRIAKEKPGEAVGYYTESLVHGYRALEGDPEKRVVGITAQYNHSLAELLRLLRAQNQVRPGSRVELPTSHTSCFIDIELHSKRWQQKDFQDFEFANDFQVLALRNHYHTSGVGVPLIAIRNHLNRESPQDKFYPHKLCYPLTAFMRVEESTGPHASHVQLVSTESSPALSNSTLPNGAANGAGPNTAASPPHNTTRIVLELHDATDHDRIRLAGNQVPLETDLTTPLAYYLDQPELHEETVSTLGLLKPASVEQLQGLYMLEPFDPNRIPVVMVHGLWSSPATWMEMFNDLRSDPVLRAKYQFWFYLYPTGSPFWVSASEMRADLEELRSTFDPHRNMPALDQTVMVGHSMGGLLSRLQTIDSGDNFWRIVSERNFNDLKAAPEVKQYVSSLFYFQPNASIRRVVTIGTPHRGSRFANGFTRWLGTKLIAFPMANLAKRQELFLNNPGFFKPQMATRVMTSIDSLSPDSPMLKTLLSARPAPWVNYHNIVGDQPRSRFTSWYAQRGDGVVSVASASLADLPRLSSQIIVPDAHVTLHRHPQAISEVRRVLHSQLVELSPHVAQPIAGPFARVPAVATIPPTVRVSPPFENPVVQATALLSE